jgi:uncharacterized membrane protein YwzB
MKFMMGWDWSCITINIFHHVVCAAWMELDTIRYDTTIRKIGRGKILHLLYFPIIILRTFIVLER